jgi:hypothetical protein
MKLYKILSTVIFLSLVISACSQDENIELMGEGKHWRVIYKVDKSINKFNYTIMYIGSEKAPEKIAYRISGTEEIQENEEELDKLSVFQSKNLSCSDCESIEERNEILASIDWEGKTETIELYDED